MAGQTAHSTLHIPRSTFLTFSALLLLMSLPGCGGDGKVTVSGSVTQGGAPVEQGTIRFSPADGAGPTAETIIQQGKYEVRTLPGNKQVTIVAMKKIGEYRDPASDGPAIPQYEETKEEVIREIKGGTQDFSLNFP